MNRRIRLSKEEIARTKRALKENKVKVDLTDEDIERSLIVSRLFEGIPGDEEQELLHCLVAIERRGLSVIDMADCFEEGIPFNGVDLEYERIDEEDDDYGDKEEEAIEFLAAVRRVYEIFEQICTSTKIFLGRGMSRKTVALRTAIMAAFEETDKPVTVRQMFYMLTVRGTVEKEETGYRKAQRQLVLMRREGEIPYDWIADNTRWMRKPDTYAGLEAFFERSARYYRQDLWVRSSDYVEVWCEKDALAGVLVPVTSEYDVPLMVARGYSSETFAYNAAEAMKETGKPCYVYYVGDFDPSGWQMATSLKAKLLEFGAPVTFTRLAVNADQVNAWNLPTRPSKKADTRCKAFFAEFGYGTPSVELDALHPDRLRSLVRDAVEGGTRYARAREAQADTHVEEMLDVARKAARAKSSEEAQGYRLLVDTLKWRASKMKPKNYGDKLLVAGDAEAPVKVDLRGEWNDILRGWQDRELSGTPADPVE